MENEVTTCELALGDSQRIRQTDPAKYRVEHRKFDELHPDGKNLIINWAKRAAAPDTSQECFEGFIFAWIALDGWASCVSEEESDTGRLKALILDNELAKKFEQQQHQNEEFAAAVRNFGELWPIFRAPIPEYLPKKGEARSKTVTEYWNRGAAHRPGCSQTHKALREPIPMDWPHTLSAIYQVRCNLFHGHKGMNCENDATIVAKAYTVLAHLLTIVGLGIDAIPNQELPVAHSQSRVPHS